jgi:hypothetical protein
MGRVTVKEDESNIAHEGNPDIEYVKSFPDNYGV